MILKNEFDIIKKNTYRDWKKICCRLYKKQDYYIIPAKIVKYDYQMLCFIQSVINN